VLALQADIKSTTGYINYDLNSDGSSELTLNANGLGVFVSNPSQRLEVSGNALISGNVMIGGGTGVSTLNVNGTIGFNTKTMSSNATLGDASYILADSSGGNIILTLPNVGTENGKVFSIKKISPLNSLKISTGDNTFEDGASLIEIVSSTTSLLPCLRFISNGKNWLSLDSYLESDLTKIYPMRIKIRTTNAGISNSQQFTLPLASGYSYDLTVFWGDGSSNIITAYNDSPLTHTYGVSGDYTVSILENSLGKFGGIKFNNSGDKQKLLDLQAWGRLDWKTFSGAFFGCNVMQITATDHSTAKTSSVTDFYSAWYACTAMTGPFPLIDTSKATSFVHAWRECRSLTGPFPLLNSSNVTNMTYAWVGCSALTGPFPAINTSKATSFLYTWYACSVLTGPFPALNSSNVTNFSQAWRECYELSGQFPLLDSSKVTDFGAAWYHCRKLTGQFPALNSSNVTSFSSAWYNCQLLTGPFPALNSSNVTTINSAWKNSAITGIGLLDLRKITDGTSAFTGVTLPTADWSNLLVNLSSNFISSNVTLDGGSSVRNASGNAAKLILSGNGWIINDGT
jgi:hypothetical protein